MYSNHNAGGTTFHPCFKRKFHCTFQFRVKETLFYSHPTEELGEGGTQGMDGLIQNTRKRWGGLYKDSEEVQLRAAGTGVWGFF